MGNNSKSDIIWLVAISLFISFILIHVFGYINYPDGIVIVVGCFHIIVILATILYAITAYKEVKKKDKGNV